MSGDSDYLTTHEAALAVVATAMKKARLPLHALLVNSFMGGLLFTSGGMLHVLVQSECGELLQTNPGLARLLQGLLYPIGLFYVVILGVELFNSNILFFSTGLVRGAISWLDLIISWTISWWLNLVGNIFTCYVIFHYSHVTSTETMISGSIDIVVQKASSTFVETLIKGMAGNFFVSLAIYLQLMAKPLHVKFFLMLLPVFCFVSMGFTHSVADMYMLIIGAINGAPVSVGTLAWKVFLPGVLGNIIGGSFFGIFVTWYLHLYLVELDRKTLNLPNYEARDEQPELNSDSRVVRSRFNTFNDYNDHNYDNGEMDLLKAKEYVSSSEHSHADYPVHGIVRSPSTGFSPLDRASTNLTRGSVVTNMSARSNVRSPKNVFPVYGMGPPLRRERTIASGNTGGDAGDTESGENFIESIGISDEVDTPSAEYIGGHLKRLLSSRSSGKEKEQSSDIESQMTQRSSKRRLSNSSFLRRLSSGLNATRLSQSELNRRMNRSGITHKAANAANEVAGTTELVATPSHEPTNRKEASHVNNEGGEADHINLPTESTVDTAQASLNNNSLQSYHLRPSQ